MDTDRSTIQEIKELIYAEYENGDDLNAVIKSVVEDYVSNLCIQFEDDEERYKYEQELIDLVHNH